MTPAAPLGLVMGNALINLVRPLGMAGSAAP